MSIRSTPILFIAFLFFACGGEPQPDSDTQLESASESVAQSKPIAADVEQCTFTENASIYDRPASQLRAEHHDDDSDLNLTVWRMHADGAHQINLHVRQGEETYRINTVEGSSLAGNANVVVTPQGSGTTIEIDGKDQSGNDLRATISCASLGEPVVEGG